jgi:hypothetical protein
MNSKVILFNIIITTLAFAAASFIVVSPAALAQIDNNSSIALPLQKIMGNSNMTSSNATGSGEAIPLSKCVLWESACPPS